MKKRSNMQVAFRLTGLVRPLLLYMLLAIVSGLAGHLCAAYLTIYGSYGILEILREPAQTKSELILGDLIQVLNLRIFFFWILVFAIFRGILHYGEQMCNHYIAFKLLALLRRKVFTSLRRLCPAKLEGRDKGDLISLITSDIELLEVFYAHTLSPVAIAIGMSLWMSLFIGSYHPLLGGIALSAYFVVGVLIPSRISKWSGDDGNLFRDRSGQLSSFVLESMRGLPEIIRYGRGRQRLEQIREKTDQLLLIEEKMKKRVGWNMGVTTAVILGFSMAMLFVAARLHAQGAVGFDGVLIPFVAMMSSFGPTVALANLGSTLQNTFAAGNRVLDILEEEPMVREIEEGKSVFFSGAAADHLSFRYENELILEDLSLDIPQNRILGISGKSGSGKSTLLKLFMRFWEAGEGKVLVSGEDVNTIKTENLRALESFVTQETHLFDDTIANNVRIAKLDADDEEVVAACKKAALDEFIRDLPKGYETRVGELGDRLSGGERQRIGMARAFLHDAPFMLLDEPTSNLDSLSEGIILRSICRQSEEKTVVLISHRESTLRIADEVFAMKTARQS
ncbi:MAG: ABC transporter ATP-binding protein [Peptostreptococcaceae bacterium]|nr:ABC transporter ATP-binding protein [Peptostreptococcaceae bacterium]